MKSKILIGVVIIILILFFIMKSVWGGTRETTYDVPSEFQGVQFTFKEPMFYQIGEPVQETSTFKKIGNEIVPDQTLKDIYRGRFQYEIVSTSTKFTIVEVAHLANYGLQSIDSGTLGLYYYILQNENGNRFFISGFRFKHYISTINK
ncbi:MAG: hypothetical protein WD874_00325 [Parcubacteria group bacterium]